MQNRSNRGLLFGSRAAPANDTKTTTDTEKMESDNQLAIDQLRGSAGTIKDIAINIDSSVNDQNRMLNQMDKRFESANTLVGDTLNVLKEMVNDRSSSRMIIYIGGFFMTLLLIYHLLNKH